MMDRNHLERLEQQLNHMIRVGVVVGVEPETHRVRVKVPDQQGWSSYTLAVLVRSTGSDREAWLPDINEHGLCLFLPYGQEQGFWLGSIYSDQETPPDLAADGGEDVRQIEYQDGTTEGYHRGRHRSFLHLAGDAESNPGGGIDRQVDLELIKTRITNGNLLIKIKGAQQIDPEPPLPAPAEDWRQLEGKGYVVISSDKMIVLNAPQILLMGGAGAAPYNPDLLDDEIWAADGVDNG